MQPAPTVPGEFEAALLSWLKEVELILKHDWSLTFEYAGWSERDKSDYFALGLSPARFVEWYAAKYDLIDFRTL
jgi:hypothetical protein